MTEQLNETQQVIDKPQETPGNPETFGKRLKAIRTFKCMNQRQFGKLLGIHNTTVGRLENGRRIPSIEEAIHYAEKLGQQYPDDFVRLCVQDELSSNGYTFDVYLISHDM